MEDFMENIRRGFFRVENPFNRKESIVECSVDRVHTIVFWSKNYGKFLSGGHGKALREKGYNLFFNFTVNSRDPVLEPGVPSLDERLSQMERLRELAGAESVVWRFDPVCHYRGRDGRILDNLRDFSRIADAAGGLGIRSCVTSFLDLYAKVTKRAAATGIRFVDPPMEKKVEILLDLAGRLKRRNMMLRTCCEKEALVATPPGSGVEAASCVPNHVLEKLHGPGVSLRKDSGQRANLGCGCRVSKDIGSYRLHPCWHNCLFCYANPAAPEKRNENRID
jgi:hypothetical protein